jgi:tRNA threonylcarbamoyladenosine biosynthesis protein TsaE
MLSFSAVETISYAKKVAASLKNGDIIALKAEMGAGKTTFTRGLCMGLGLGDVASSPTFALVNEYRAKGKLPLFHFDMYRIMGNPESLGYDIYQEQDGIIVIEWFENVKDFIKPTKIVGIKILGDVKREIIVSDFK